MLQGIPCKQGLKSLLGYKDEGMGYFSHIGIILLKSTETCWVASALDLAMALLMDAKSKVCHSSLSHQAWIALQGCVQVVLKGPFAGAVTWEFQGLFLLLLCFDH